MFLENNVLSIKEGIPWQQADNRALILDTEDCFAHELNSSALFVWQHLSNKIDFSTLTKYFLDEYDGEPELLKSDLVNLLNEFKKNDLIEVN